jgi:hypothetical protein
VLTCDCRLPAQTLDGFVPRMRTQGRLQIGMGDGIVVFDPARGRRVNAAAEFTIEEASRRHT